MGIGFQTAVLPQKPVAYSGISKITAVNATGEVVSAPNLSFLTRADLLASRLPAGVTTVAVQKYATAGPIVNMIYSINGTDQTSSDPTSMAITVVNTDGTTATKYTKLISPKVTPAMMGAPIDGTSDDGFAINRAIQYFKNCYPDASGPAWISYVLKSAVKISVDDVVVDFRGWQGWWLADLATTFTNTDYNTNLYTDLSTVVQIFGTRTVSSVPRRNTSFRGVRIKPIAYVAQRHTLVISAFNCVDLVVRDCEVASFSAGVMIGFNSVVGGRVEVCDNHIHDLAVNTTFPNGSQSSNMDGIVCDNDTVFGISTKRMQVTGNRIHDFVTGAVTLAAYTFPQSDAITLNGAVIDTFHLVEGNTIYNVSNGISMFGSRNTISNNNVDNCDDGLHLDHGFSKNLVEGNHLTNCHRTGIGLGTHGADCKNNTFTGNKIHVVGGWVSGYTTACVTFDNETGGIIDGNLFQGNEYDATGAYTVFYNQCTTGKNLSVGDKFIAYGTDTQSVVIATASNKKLLQINAPAGGTRVKLKPTSNFTIVGATTTRQKLLFDSVDFDQRGEADAANSQIKTKMPGWYTIRFAVDGAPWRAGILYIFDVTGAATDWGGTITLYTALKNWPTAAANETYFLEYRSWLEQNATISVGVQKASTSDTIAQLDRGYFEIIKD